MTRKRPFDPMGKGYDYKTAKEEGVTPEIGPDGRYHWGSRAPKSGKVLKGRSHKTFGLAQAADELRGYKQEFKGGRYVSTKKKKKASK